MSITVRWSKLAKLLEGREYSATVSIDCNGNTVIACRDYRLEQNHVAKSLIKIMDSEKKVRLPQRMLSL